jgi:hypothetical protein
MTVPRKAPAQHAGNTGTALLGRYLFDARSRPNDRVTFAAPPGGRALTCPTGWGQRAMGARSCGSARRGRAPVRPGRGVRHALAAPCADFGSTGREGRTVRIRPAPSGQWRGDLRDTPVDGAVSSEARHPVLGSSGGPSARVPMPAPPARRSPRAGRRPRGARRRCRGRPASSTTATPRTARGRAGRTPRAPWPAASPRGWTHRCNGLQQRIQADDGPLAGPPPPFLAPGRPR